MPIKQTRMIALIEAAAAAQQAVHDIHATVKSAIELHLAGIIGKEEFINQLHTAFWANQLSIHHVATIVREDQHFKDCAKRNDYATNRIAHQRATMGMPKQQHTQPAKHRVGMLRTPVNLSQEQIAKAQARPNIDSGAIMKLADIKPATPEELAADDAMAAGIDKNELAAHIAAERKGDQ